MNLLMLRFLFFLAENSVKFKLQIKATITTLLWQWINHFKLMFMFRADIQILIKAVF